MNDDQDLTSQTDESATAEILSEIETGDKVEVKTNPEGASSGEANDKYLRALADYQNLVRQTAKDKDEFYKYALSDFLREILPVYEHLKLALSGISETEAKSPWAEGVTYVLRQFKEVLNNRGLEEIKTVGEKFNHDFMEAAPGSTEGGETVSREIRTGYLYKGKVLIPAQVIVE